MNKTFVISDLHFGHLNIIEFERTEFKSINEHDEFIIKKWNSVVKPTDTVYCLGDISFGLPQADVKRKVSRLLGHKILVKGNHDKNTNSYYKDIGFDEVYKGPIYVCDGKVILSHEPAQEAFNNPYVINIYGHTHNSIVDLPNYHCVSAKIVKYIPQNIDHYIGISTFKDRDEAFTKEWYFKNIKFISGKYKGMTPEEIRKENRHEKFLAKTKYKNKEDD